MLDPSVINLSHLPAINTKVLSWRYLQPSDRSSLASLITQMESVDNPPYRTSAAELDELFAARFIGAGGWDADGAMGAYAIVQIVEEGNLTQLVCSGGVAPRWRLRGIGRAVIEWEIEVAHILAAQISGPSQVVTYTDNAYSEIEALMYSVGFEKGHTYTEMRRALVEHIPQVSPGKYMTIMPWQEEFDDHVRRAHNELMSFTEGFEPISQQVWEKNRDQFAPDWSFIALDKSHDRAQVAGYLLSARYDQDWQARGWKEGYTEILGVLPKWSKDSVGQALLGAALEAYYNAGMQYAAVGLDTSNSAAAEALYQQMGYEVTGRSTRWEIYIPALNNENPNGETLNSDHPNGTDLGR